tara:strand:+ start:488 stop:766 length:279 start_codon:yes stop_codon:yes gene_type:complete
MDRNLNIREILVKLFMIIFILIMALIIYQVLRAIFGGTWENENIIISGVGIMMTGVFVIVGFLINQARSIGRMEVGLKGCFERVKRLEDSKG